MAKGIRQFVEARFTKLLPKLQDMGGTGFRRKLLDDTVAQFDISMASASAAYNYVIQKFRSENPKAVAGLGRTEAGLNMVAANTRGSQGRMVANSRSRAPKFTQTAGNVTIVRARDGETVVDSIPRTLAKDLVANSGGRGRPKLAIKEDMAEA